MIEGAKGKAMSYKQAMRWGKKHPKGTRQPMVFSTGSGFWPSGAFLEDYWKYRTECAAKGVEPLGCEAYYNFGFKTAKEEESS